MNQMFEGHYDELASESVRISSYARINNDQKEQNMVADNSDVINQKKKKNE